MRQVRREKKGEIIWEQTEKGKKKTQKRQNIEVLWAKKGNGSAKRLFLEAFQIGHGKAFEIDGKIYNI